jgi:riboflavin biosynthesis protein RibD
VSGAGIKQLAASGIAVECGLLEPEVRELNLGFEKRMTRGVPRVIVKIAMSLDGRVALANGVSKWITGEPARADVQHLRAAASAVLTGIETVIADDPQLNVRDPAIELLGRQPLRVVLDTRLRLKPNARVLQGSGNAVVFTAGEKLAQAGELREAGAEVVGVPLDGDGHVDLQNVLTDLGRRECNDVLVEAGPTLAGKISAARTGRRADCLHCADHPRLRGAGDGAAAATGSHRGRAALYATRHGAHRRRHQTHPASLILCSPVSFKQSAKCAQSHRAAATSSSCSQSERSI